MSPETRAAQTKRRQILYPLAIALALIVLLALAAPGRASTAGQSSTAAARSRDMIRVAATTSHSVEESPLMALGLVCAVAGALLIYDYAATARRR
jgi:hypothetical protein